jgi:hypothetical protein
LAEQLTLNQRVLGSNPSAPTKFQNVRGRRDGGDGFGKHIASTERVCYIRRACLAEMPPAPAVATPTAIARTCSPAAAAEIAAEPPKRRNARFQRVLERLRNRSSITLHQFQAGDRLYRDYMTSGSPLGCLTMRWEPPTPRGSGSRDTPGSIAARERFDAALREAGRGLAPILMHVCVTDEPPTSWAGLNGKAETDGLPVLRVALDTLIAFYRDGPARMAA